MKKICIPFAIAFLFVINSCSKDTATPAPIPVVPKLDTLTTGWKKIILDTSQTIADIYFTNNTTGYLVSDKVYRSTDGGLTWNPISDRSFINLTGTSNGNVFFAGGGNGLYKLANGTSLLTKVKESTSVSSDVFFVDDNNGYYLEAGVGLFNSGDGGVTWEKLATTGVDFSSALYPTLFFTNKNTGWITGSNTVYKTDGSATSWGAPSFTDNALSSTLFTSIFSTPDNTVYSLATNAKLYKSPDGGTTFSSIKSFPQANGWYGDIFFVDNNIGYVSGGNKIYKTTDAGNTWNTVVTLANTQIIELHFTDAHHGWACGAKGTLLIYNN